MNAVSRMRTDCCFACMHVVTRCFVCMLFHTACMFAIISIACMHVAFSLTIECCFECFRFLSNATHTCRKGATSTCVDVCVQRNQNRAVAWRRISEEHHMLWRRIGGAPPVVEACERSTTCCGGVSEGHHVVVCGGV